MFEIGSWTDVENTILTQPVGAVMRIPKHWIPHPTYHGLSTVFGFPEGQLADFHKPFGFGGRLFVREFHQWYEVHREDFYPWHPVSQPVQPTSPAALIAGSAALGAALGSALGESPKAAGTGAVLGALLATVLISNTQS